jgi:predicted ribosomally synthesized peptide with nif11-like leader
VLRDADRKVVAGLYREQHLPLLAMSEEQLSALLAKLKDDAGLQEKLKGAADLDTAVAMAKEAGFDVSKADWLRYQAKQTLELNDEELEGVAGGAQMAPGRTDSQVPIVCTKSMLMLCF